MGDWQKVLKVDKGLLAGKNFIYGDMSNSISFSDYTSNYDIIAIVPTSDHKTADEYIGYHVENLNYFINEHGTGEYLLAAWNVNPQGGESGAYLCMVLNLSNYVVTETNTSVRVQLKITKRLYDYAGTHYTESFPLGTYFQSHDLTLRNTNGTDDQQGPGVIFFFKHATFSGVKNYCVGYGHLMKSGNMDCYGSGMGYRIKESYFKSSDGWGDSAEIPEEEGGDSPEFGPQSEPEGYEPAGGFDDSSDPIGMPALPQSVLSLGFVNVYKCDAGSLTMLGGELFPDISFPSSLTDIGPVLAAIGDSIWNSKLIDYVISVHCIPGNVTGGNLEDIKVGTRTMTGILGRPITSEYVDFDFGTVTLPKYYKNYADYFTEIQLYLPFYGFVSIRPEEIIDGEINVKYRFNVIDGSFIACIFATSSRSKLTASLIGQYGGSCIVHLPVSNLSYASMFSSLIGAGATGAMAAMGVGGATATAAAIGLTASQGIVNAAQGGDVKKSNSYNASSSFMTRAKPYLIVTRPVSSFSTRYNTENGLPSNVSMTIGSCSGFTQVNEPIINFACTDEEQREIIAALKEGVIV